MTLPPERASHFSRVLAPGVALLIGVTLICLAVPRAIAYFDVISWGDFSQAGPRPGAPLEETDAVLADYRDAAAWLPGDADLQQMHGRLALLALRPDRAALKDEAASALRAAVAAAPNRTCAWALYAYAGSRYDLPSIAIKPSVRLAYILSPPTPACASLRISAILALPQGVPDDLKPYVDADLRSIWHSRARRDLAFIYRDAPAGARPFIAEGVFGGATARARMDRFLEVTLDEEKRRTKSGAR